MKKSIVTLSLLVFFACGEEKTEGMISGDCTDRADNDGDGAFDCNDEGCFGSPDCQEDSDVNDTGDTDNTNDTTDPFDTDADEDGVTPNDGDCDDTNPNINPSSNDDSTDGVDQNCDGVDGVDVDQDGYTAASSGGQDCNDADQSIYPGAEEIYLDGIDQNCDGVDGNDGDGDGFASVETGGTDCNDNDSSIFVGSTEVPEDGIDQDCNGVDASNCMSTACDMNIDLGDGFSMDMVLISAGSDPQGRYTIPKDFYLMTTEVTQGMFNQVMGYEAYDGQSSLLGVGDDYPAYYVSWYMAADYANQVTQRHNVLYGTSLDECYICNGSGSPYVTCNVNYYPYDCNGYVLPTEAEWEYAARSGSQYDFWTPNGGGDASEDICGDGVNDTTVTIQDGSSTPPSLSEYAWFCGNQFDGTYTDTAKPVGLKLPNGFGLYDMQGNVFEWTNDWYGCSFPENTSFPYCDTPSYSKVTRGGRWLEKPNIAASSERSGNAPHYRYSTFGFRVGMHPN